MESCDCVYGEALLSTQGRLILWPSCSCSGTTPGLTACMAANVTPRCCDRSQNVSPCLMVWLPHIPAIQQYKPQFE
jgi:hypothetical protein